MPYGLGQIEKRAEIGIVVTKIGGKTIDSNVFLSVRASDCDVLPAFAMHDERLFKGARAKEFDKSHSI